MNMTSDTPLRDRRREYPQWRETDYDASFGSNLVLHAMRELTGMGYPGSDPMNRRIAYHIMDVVILFSRESHSGSSANYTIQMLQRLLNFENLGPLTTNPDEWVEVGDQVWQNSRRSEAFSTNGGKTYYMLSEARHWISKVIPYSVSRHLPRSVWIKMLYPIRRSIRR